MLNYKDETNLINYTDKRDLDYNEDAIQKAERIVMNTCGAYNLVVPKTVVMEENPAYATIITH